MTAVLKPPRHLPDRPEHRVVTLRPAPRREPPFDDELPEPPVAGRYDQRLPFAVVPAPTPDVLMAVRPHGLPDPRIWARRLLVGLVESADGRRPLQQLAAMLSPSVNRGLTAEFERSAATGSRHWLQHGTIRSVRGDEPAVGVAELCATIETGDRVRAVALRLENRGGRWLCTRLHLG